MNYLSFTDLEVYKECRQLRINISNLIKNNFPIEEKYKLSDQIVRSSRSVTACIAEGYGRYYFKENIQFCRMARGSLSETLEHLITAYDEKYISEQDLLMLKTKIDSCGKLLNGYINYLKNSKKPKEEE
ncbi:MAG: four helix bundle protein [Emticicia sp.]|nr:four helix bundle protein [Emticicia sp.]